MKKLAKLLVLTAIGTAAVAAHAQTYGEIGYLSLNAKQDLTYNGTAYNFKASPTALRGIFGYELNPNLAIEALGAFGLGSGDVKFNGNRIAGAKMEIDNAMGVYLKPKTKLNDSMEIFGRVGFARSEGTFSGNGGSASASENDVSYGFGMSYAINPSTSLNADYMSYLNKDGFKATGITLGVGFKF